VKGSSQQNWDLAVIGGGAGGVAAAVRARQLGARVVVIEREHLGGICMNRGCIPTKSLRQTLKLYRAAAQARQFGLKIPQVEIDWPVVMKKKEDTVAYLRLGTEALLKSNGIEVLHGQARLQGEGRLEVGGHKVGFKKAILAVGSEWSRPRIEGIDSEGVITAEDVLSLTEAPPSVAVLGSSPVALEAAQYLLLLGAEVVVLEAAARLMPEEDRTIGRRLASILKDQGLEIVTRVKVLGLVPKKDGLAVRLEDKDGRRELLVSRFLYADRKPAIEGLGLEAVGLEPTDKGLQVDRHLQTSSPGLWAIGDVTGGPMFSHRASAMGLVAGENAAGGSRPFRARAVPRVFYTIPEAASVGLTEKEAKAQGYDAEAAMVPYGVNARAIVNLETDGAVKVVADSQTGEVLGVHILGPNASEMIGEGALALDLEATLEDLAWTIRPHPSFSECQPDAAREVTGWGIYLPR